MLPREPEVRRIEKQLVRSLDNILENIKSEHTKDISVLQRKYDLQVQHALRAAITKVYTIAGENVLAKKHKQGQPKPLTQHVMTRLKEAGYLDDAEEKQLLSAALASPLNTHFLTGRDLGQIVNKVREYIGIFWRRVSASFRQGDILESTKGFNTPATLNSNALVTSLAVDAVTDSYTDATTDKITQIDGGGTVKFVTAHDERVCTECNSLDGVVMDIDALDEEPPIHSNCRCRLDPTGAGYE